MDHAHPCAPGPVDSFVRRGLGLPARPRGLAGHGIGSEEAVHLVLALVHPAVLHARHLPHRGRRLALMTLMLLHRFRRRRRRG